MSLCVLLPTRNEVDNIALLVNRLEISLAEVGDVEVLFVDDSDDATPEVITSVATTSSLRIRLLHRDEPEGGLSGAIIAGLGATDAVWVVVMDSDLQHPPELIPSLYHNAVTRNSDVVVATRYAPGGSAGGLESGFRRHVSSWSGRAAKLLFPVRLAGCSDPMSGFFVARRDALDLKSVTRCGYKILLALLSHRQLEVSEVSFHFGKRHAGESKASFVEGLRYLQLLILLRTGAGGLFTLVGASGAVANLVAVVILTRARTPYLIAATAATQVAILWNFAGSELIVFRDRRTGKLWHRALRFTAVSETDLLRLPFVALLVRWAGLSTVLATALTLLAFVAFRYFLTSNLVYHPQAPQDPNPGVRAPAVLRLVDDERIVRPPSDTEKYLYLNAGQHRWFAVAQYVSFLAVAYSLYGFATTSYWTFIALVVAALLLSEQSLSLFSSTRIRRVDYRGHAERVSTWSPKDHLFPSVDVFLPTCGEDVNVLRNTLHYVAEIEWQGQISVHVLDDSHRPSVRSLAENYGANYIARPTNEYFKAGNLRYAFERTHGDHILILDADFVPRSDILHELIPYMDDPAAGIVQSPQFFDTHKQMNWVQRSAGATQEMFYRFIQTSRDRDGAAICVGSSAVYRRAAIEAMGGFPKVTHSEDLYTSMYMREHGYSLRYVPVVVSKGVAPDNLDNFIAQQYRWCQGTMMMMSSHWFHRTDLPVRQRLAFWAGFLYYADTAIGSLVIPIPALVMAVFFPQYVHWWNNIFLLGTILLWLICYPLVMRQRWRISVLRIQAVYSYAHLFTILDLMRKRAAAWHPTGVKDRAPTAVRVKHFYTLYLGITSVLLAAFIILRAVQFDWVNYLGMAAFSLINFYVMLPLVYEGICSEVRARASERSDNQLSLVVLSEQEATA